MDLRFEEAMGPTREMLGETSIRDHIESKTVISAAGAMGQ